MWVKILETVLLLSTLFMSWLIVVAVSFLIAKLIAYDMDINTATFIWGGIIMLLAFLIAVADD